MISSLWPATARCTTDRMTAFRPGQSPPAVRTPMRMVVCLLLAVVAGEPIRLFHAPRGSEILTGALTGARGIVKRVPLTPVGDFYVAAQELHRDGVHT